MRRGLAVVAIGLMALALTACGGGSEDMSPSAASTLDAAVAEVRQAVEANDDDAARAHLTALRTTVASMAATGAITAERTLAITHAITSVEAELAKRAAPTSTTTTPVATTTSSTTSTTEAENGRGKDKDEDRDDD